MVRILQRLGTPVTWFFGAADDRIYACLRMAFALVALVNLASLWPDRQAFFSDAGLVDQGVAISQADPVYLSIFQWARSDCGVTSVMLVTVIALGMLVAGVGARIAALWVLLWHISYMARAPLLFVSWDNVLRCFSFLVLISPIGKSWTLPMLWRRGGISPEFVPRYGLVLMRLQVTVIYWQVVLNRLVHPDTYWRKGEFLSYFLLSHHARWPGAWVLEWEGLLTIGTYGIQVAEVAIPILLWGKRTRWWGILLGVSLHLGIGILGVGFEIFGLTMVMTYLAFLRNEDLAAWDRWWRRMRPAASPDLVKQA